MYLGIDLGQKTTGLAVSDSSIASVYGTVTHKDENEALEKVCAVIDSENVDTVVIGFVEGKIKTLFVDFARKLKEIKPDLKIEMWDETLTSLQARETLIKLQVPKFKRAAKEHEIAASLILQGYLDSRE